MADPARSEDDIDVKQAVDDMMSAFEEFKAANEDRLKQIEEKGAADPLIEEKLAKLESAMDSGEKLSARFSAHEAEVKRLNEVQNDLEKRLNRPPAPQSEEVAAERKSRVNLWARGVVQAHLIGVQNLPDDQLKAINDAKTEMKSMTIGDDTTGGYLAPKDYVLEIIKGETEMSPARQLARIRQTALKSIQMPKRTGQFAARRTSEHGTRTETEGLRYGLIEINTPEMYALIDISEQNLEDSAFDFEAEIRMEATEQFAVKEGQEFVSGSGVDQMEGILTNSDVATTNTGSATGVTADGLLTLKHDIKTAYARMGAFIMNRTTLGSVRKLKDSQGQYLWMPGIQFGRPNTIDGDPYTEVPDMPNEAAGARPVAFGDFRRAYTIVDRIAMSMLRDPYTQATSGMIRFLFRKRVGGRVVLAEAIRTNTCAL